MFSQVSQDHLHVSDLGGLRMPATAMTIEKKDSVDMERDHAGVVVTD